MQFRRYAIYVVPDGNALADFGASWLGWDVVRGVPLPHPETDLPIEDITKTPRKYGFHGTVHWPVTLSDPSEAGLAQLTEAVAGFCASRRAIELESLELARLGRFLALVPTRDEAALKDMAADLVRLLQPFRAPVSEAAIARRRAGHLSPEQDALLTKWGYPYVMDQFRYHMTLTGKLSKAQLPKVEAVLNTLLQAVLPQPFVIDALSLVGEDNAGRFHVIETFPFRGA
ncbi:DUF1045 domain-containing protein [Roseovarius sp. 2305UL8-3]|uniref:DUF1045 domain-containing protein n=1 Tax=Roseovarius conchicola TaxID=3121636 RepID=UPI003529C789